MKKLYFFGFIIFFNLTFLNGQNFTSHQIIKFWQTSDVTQSLKAEETYIDLQDNYLKTRYNKLISELENYLKENPDIRLEARLFIYKIVAKFDKEVKFSDQEKYELMKLFKEVLVLEDKQLLSELYTVYSEQGPGKLEDKLYYKKTSTEIQEQIGAEHFPRFHLKYLSLSISYHRIGDYNESAKTALKGLKILEKGRDYSVFEHSMLLDILGSANYELQRVDSGIYYYEEIQNLLHSNQTKNSNHYRKDWWEIWNGVSKGGIARGLILKGNFDEAIPLLKSNISSSEKHQQLGDLIKAKNLLAEIYYSQGKFNDALKQWKESYAIALKLNPVNKDVINASEGLSKGYEAINRYDSAYFYLQQKILFENERNSQISQSKLHAVNARLQYENAENEIKESELIIQKQKTNRNIILACSVGLLVIVIFSYRHYRIRQKAELEKLEIQQKITNLEKQKVEAELKAAHLEIDTFIENVNQKNELIDSISNKLNKIKKQESSKSKQLENTLNELRNTTIITDEDWIKFQADFDKLHFNFSQNLYKKFPTLTPSEQRYLMLSKIGLNHEKMAQALGVSRDAVRVTWNRVRNKMGGTLEDTPQSLIEKWNLDKKIR